MFNLNLNSKYKNRFWFDMTKQKTNKQILYYPQTLYSVQWVKTGDMIHDLPQSRRAH